MASTTEALGLIETKGLVGAVEAADGARFDGDRREPVGADRDGGQPDVGGWQR